MSRWLSIKPGKSTGVVLWDDDRPLAHGTIDPYPAQSWVDRRALRVTYRRVGSDEVTRFRTASPSVAVKPFSHALTVAVISEWQPRARLKDHVRISVARYWALEREVFGMMDGAMAAAGAPVLRVYEDQWRKLISIRTSLKFPSGAGHGSAREREYFRGSVRRQWPSISPVAQADCEALWAGQWAHERGFAPRLDRADRAG